MRCLIALGGNVGEVRSTLRTAWSQLTQVPGLRPVRLSAFYRTKAVGGSAGNDFLNAVGEVDSLLDPLAILDLLLTTEDALGRKRDVHWGPRTLDLDLIACGDLVIEQPRLRLPHPACWYRRFVLDPLVEIAADFVHPVQSLSFGQLQQRLLPRPLPVTLLGDQGELAKRLAGTFPEARFVASEETRDVGIRIALPESTGGADSPLVVRPAGRETDGLIFVRDVLRSALPTPLRE